MNRKEHLLAIVAEECNEVGQRATKAMRFGLKETQESQHQDNAERLVYEFNDLVAVMMMLHQEGHIPYPFVQFMQELKRNKVEKFLLHSKEQGTLDDDKIDYDQTLKSRLNCIVVDDPQRKNKPEPNVDTVSPAY